MSKTVYLMIIKIELTYFFSMNFKKRNIICLSLSAKVGL